MHRARATGLLTATTLALASLAACGSESEPDPTTSTASPIDKGTDEPTDSSSSTASDSPSSSDHVAELPKAAQERTKAGAIAFNEWYWRHRGKALTTGEADTLEKYSAKECAPCNEAIKELREAASRGVTMNKNPNSVGKASAAKRSDGGYKVTFHVEAAAYHEVLADGSRGRAALPASYDVTTDTRWDGEHWVVRNSFLSNIDETEERS